MAKLNGEKFERKDKYLVLSIDDIRDLSSNHRKMIGQICNEIQTVRRHKGKRIKSYVCVSDEMEIFSHVWNLVEKEMQTKNETETL